MGADWDTKSRRDFLRFIDTELQFLTPYLSERHISHYSERVSEFDNNYKFPLTNLTRVILLREAVKDTGFSLDITDSQILSIENETELTQGENSLLIDKEVNRVMGEFGFDEVAEDARVTGSTGCSLVTYSKFKELVDENKDMPYTKQLGMDYSDWLLKTDPREVFDEIPLRGLYISTWDVALCELTGVTEEYEAIGDGTPGKYVKKKCRK